MEAIPVNCKVCGLRFATMDGRIPDHDCRPMKAPEKPEFKIIRDSASKAQTIMNQWRHDYELDIISAQGFSDSDIIIVTLWRRKK